MSDSPKRREGTPSMIYFKKVTLEYKPITRKVLSKTLDRMKNQRIIERDVYAPETRGGKRNSWLTDDVKWQIEQGLFEGVEYKKYADSEQEKEVKARKIKQAISLLLILAGSSNTRLESVTKVEPGNILVRDRRTGKPLICRSISIHGVSIDDIIKGRINDPVGEISQTLPKAVIEQAMKILQKEDFPVIIPVNSHNQSRYEIDPKFESLRDFLITSRNILVLLVWFIRKSGFYLKKSSPCPSSSEMVPTHYWSFQLKSLLFGH